MQILLIVFNTIGKGTYRRAFQFGRHLVRRGHRVCLVATARSRRVGVVAEQIDGITVVESPDLFTGSLRSGWDLWNTLNRIIWLRNQEFDVVHAFEARPTVLFPAFYIKYVRHVPLIMDWADWFGRGGSVEERPNPVVRTMLRPIETFFEENFRTRADGTTVICTTLQQRVITLGVPNESIRLIPNGSETDRLHVLDHKEARRRIGQPEEGLLIGYIGSIFRRDAELMARAFDQVCEQQSSVRLLIIGYCPVNIAHLVKNPGALIQTGFIEERRMNDYLAACDVCWLPLRDTNANRGRWPLKLNDYMAVGRPTVATAVGDVTALLEREPIGLLSSNEPGPFAMQTICLLKDAEQRTAMGRRARQVAETQFSWERLTSELEAHYLRVIGA